MESWSDVGEWEGEIKNLLLEGQSAAIGIFSIDGSLIYSNEVMNQFLNSESNQKNTLINPDFKTLKSAQNEGEIFDGLLTIGNYLDNSYVLKAKIYKRINSILIFGETDVLHLFSENKKMSLLNQEVNNLQRQLIKEKKALQIALTELKETQNMLIHSEKMNAMGKLVAGVAHELNNPISFVYSNLFSLESYTQDIINSYLAVEKYSTQLSNNKLDTFIKNNKAENDLDYAIEDVPDILKESKIGIERVKTIVEDLRKFSRLDESDIKNINLSENILSTISIIRPELNQKDINFTFSCPDQLLAECYPGQLNQALLNVLINSIYAVSNQGNITLTVVEQPETVNIVIKDDGQGITDGIKEKIFDPFFTTKPVGSGTGLGLSITYKIIHDLHHGTIEVKSEHNKGATFSIKIPKKINKV